MLPRFRVVAMSMERLQIRIARISVVTIDMVHFDPVVMLEEQPAIATASVLRFEQLRQSRTGGWMPSLSSAPVHPIAIIGTPVASDLDMPCDGHLTVEVEGHGVRG